jgi:hypothetical protein
LISSTNLWVLYLWKLEPKTKFQQRHVWYNLLLNQLVH